MKSTTRTIAGGMLVLSLMHTTLASVPMNGTDQIESASVEVVQAVGADGVVSGQNGQSVTNMNDVVGGQWKSKWFACGVCMFGSALALVVVPPAGFISSIGCVLLCAQTF